jgi:hypothetical protein
VSVSLGLRRRARLSAAAALLAGVALVSTAAAAPAHPAGASAHASASTTALIPTYVKGMVVNSSTGNPVSGINVTLRDPVSLDLIASDTTNANGVYRMDGLDSDEYAIKFNGSRRGYETGFLGCGHAVVASFDDACTFAPGPEGKARLDRL